MPERKWQDERNRRKQEQALRRVEQQADCAGPKWRCEPDIAIAELQGIAKTNDVVGERRRHPGNGAQCGTNRSSEPASAPCDDEEQGRDEDTLWTDKHGGAKREAGAACTPCQEALERDN